MTRTVVIGAGPAGQAAARAALSRGGEVILIERFRSLPLRKDAWPRFISKEVELSQLEKEAELTLRQLASAELRFSESVGEIDLSNRKVRTSRGGVSYDSLIISSGGMAQREELEGASKKNVHVMNTLDSFVHLSDHISELSTFAVSGTSPLALGVTETLVKLGKKVTLFAPGGVMSSMLNDSMRSSLESRISMNEVKILSSRVERVAGVGKVEAIASAGSIYPCEALVLFPRSTPNPVPSDLLRGKAGGILVDSEMRTSDSRVFAAGDCAEVRIGFTSLPMMYASSAEVTGVVAGINSIGGSAHARVSGLGFHTFFGLEVCHAGLTLLEARAFGIDAMEAVAKVRDDGETKCSILFGPRDRVVLGVQIVGSGAAPFAAEASLVVSSRISLDDLAYHDTPSLSRVPSDISPLAAAARVGLSMVKR